MPLFGTPCIDMSMVMTVCCHIEYCLHIAKFVAESEIQKFR
jgi:hypothetical protein